MACKVARRSLCGVALYQLVPVADLQIFDDLLYVLCAVLGTDQNGEIDGNDATALLKFLVHILKGLPENSSMNA